MGQKTRLTGASKVTTADGSIPSQTSSTPTKNYDDDFDDFDPRGTSHASKCLVTPSWMHFLF